jgi:Putative Ig domain
VTPLTLAGSPGTSVIAGTAYSFQPTVSSSGTTITYTIANQPTWATFNAGTGELTGTPAIANVGTTSNVTITASNGIGSASIGPFSITVTAGSASLTWVAPVANTDGTILNNLAGYHIYYGTSATALTSQISVTGAATTSYVVSGLAAGTYYFAVAAYSSAGTESAQSDVGTKTI